MEKYGVLFESIFKRKLSDENTVSYLESITKEHPYFSLAHFYLLRLSRQNVNGYKKQARKTAVLFNNNHWLNFQLVEAGFETNAPVESAEQMPESFPEKIADDVVINPENSLHTLATPPIVLPDDETVPNEGHSPVHEETEDIKIEQDIKEEESGEIEPVVENTPVTTDDTDVFEDVIADSASAKSPVQEGEIVTTVEPQKNDNDIEVVIIDETPGVAVLNNEAHSKDINTAAEKYQGVTENAFVPTESQVQQQQKETEVSMLFEPLHTTDYFASVGIKLSEEEKAAGSLGKQLKSFTEWLKTMKKVHAEQLSKTSSASDVNLSAVESGIQKMAEKSNHENDVITEAMADVLIQQGKTDKALEILEKLSLLNPAKSVYFAAKINQIKEN